MVEHQGIAPCIPVWSAIRSSEPNETSPPSHKALEGILRSDSTMSAQSEGWKTSVYLSTLMLDGFVAAEVTRLSSIEGIKSL